MLNARLGKQTAPSILENRSPASLCRRAPMKLAVFWQPRVMAKAPVGAPRLPHEVRLAKGRRRLSLKMSASCFSTDRTSADSDLG
jgi:hypothetical protein